MSQIKDPNIQHRVDDWLKANIDKQTKEEIQTLLQKNPEKLKDAFFKKLDFGTGGIRALVGLGTNRLNQYTIRMASQALANYINKNVKNNRSVVIGYDSRTHSIFFAEESAKVLAANQIKVCLLQSLRPTPFVSFALRFLHCSAGIMITASHNPPEYNGYKVYWSDGGQVLPPHDTRIIQEFEKIEKIDEIPLTTLKDENIKIIDSTLDEKYLEEVDKVAIHSKENQKDGHKLKIVYTNLHGTGITLAPKAFQRWGFTNFETVKKQEATDGSFPFAKKPNPEERKTLELGISQMESTQADLFIANDPDADRMAAGVMHQKKSEILSGNQIGCIFAHHICDSLSEQNHLPQNGAFVKSIVTSELFSEIVASYQMKCFDVLTGFKYIAEKILLWEQNHEWQFLFGAEESYGYLKGDYCRDKDGISAGCLLAEVALRQKKAGKTLLDYLYELYQKYGIYREGQISLKFEESALGLQKMQALMNKLHSSSLNTIGSLEVIQIDDYQTRKRHHLLNNTTEDLDLPQSNVLTFWLSDHTKLVIRPSGTEPKVKIYASVVEKNVKDLPTMIKKVDERLKSILETFKHAIT